MIAQLLASLALTYFVMLILFPKIIGRGANFIWHRFLLGWKAAEEERRQRSLE